MIVCILLIGSNFIYYFFINSMKMSKYINCVCMELNKLTSLPGVEEHYAVILT